MSATSYEKNIRSKQNNFSFLSFFEDKKEKKNELARNLRIVANKYFTEKKVFDAIRCIKESIQIFQEDESNDYEVRQNMKLLISYVETSKTIDSTKFIELNEYMADIFGYCRDNVSLNERYMEIAKFLDDTKKYEQALNILNKCVDSDNYKNVLEMKGDLLIKLEKYEDASDAFLKSGEKVFLKNSISSSIYCRKPLMMSILCALATKQSNIYNKKLENVLHICESFSSSQEGQCSINLIESLNLLDVDKFEETCKKYEAYSNKFTRTQVKLLLLAKELLVGVESYSKINEFTESDDENNKYDIESEIC